MFKYFKQYLKMTTLVKSLPFLIMLNDVANCYRFLDKELYKKITNEEKKEFFLRGYLFQ